MASMNAPSMLELLQFEESQKVHTSQEALVAINGVLRQNLNLQISNFLPQLREQGDL